MTELDFSNNTESLMKALFDSYERSKMLECIHINTKKL